MKIETCLITAAGFGTRMGELGKVIPKPLWPVFDKTLLDLQLAYARGLGITNVFINAHHCLDQMKDWAKNKNVTLLEEEEILGSGGCIHNMYEKGNSKQESILIINSDQFYFFDEDIIDRALKEMKQKNACAHLIGINVNKEELYNETLIIDGLLKDIQKPKGDKNYVTYSGVGIIDFSKLDFIKGESGFFKSVCNYKKKDVLMTTPQSSEYWDFGTIDKYLDSTFKVLKYKESPMFKFLDENECFKNTVIDTDRRIIELKTHGLTLYDEVSGYRLEKN